MRTIQTRIENLEKQVVGIVVKDLSYIATTKKDSDGSTLYRLGTDPENRPWMTEAEFDTYIEENYKDKSKPIVIFDLPGIL